MKRSKYHAKKVTIDGITFDSIKEGNRYCELKLLQKAGDIKDLRLQVPYTLIPEERDERGKIRARAITYVADFVYESVLDKKIIIEDVKGYRTDVYKLKKRLMKWIYGIEIKET